MDDTISIKERVAKLESINESLKQDTNELYELLAQHVKEQTATATQDATSLQNVLFEIKLKLQSMQDKLDTNSNITNKVVDELKDVKKEQANLESRASDLESTKKHIKYWTMGAVFVIGLVWEVLKFYIENLLK